MLGRITIDDVVDVITEQAEEDLQVISGLSGEVEDDDSVWQRSRVQLPWLVAGAIGSLLAATVINGFQSELGKVAALAAFIPIIGSTGGNVGIQTSSLILQSLTDTSGLTTTLHRRLLRTLLVAIINGLVVGLIAGTYTFIIGEPRLFFVVAASLLAVVMLAWVMGTVTRLLLNRIGINAAVASGPFITTANDLIGIGVYFMIAQWLLTDV